MTTVEEIDKLKKFLSQSFDHKTQILIRVAIIGIVIGVIAVAFRKSTEFLSEMFFQGYYVKAHWYEWLYLPVVACLGGFTASFITQKYANDAKGSGIPQVKHALADSGIVIRIRTMIVKFIGGVVGIASGLSLGREGPTVQIGAGIGSKVSRLLGGKHRKRAIASGAGAGLAAAFNTPIAGVIFVIEELDKNLSSVALAPAIIGSVSAAVTCRVLYGDFFTFHFQSDHAASLIELPFYILNGVLAGIFGVYFQRSICWSMDFYKKHLSHIPAIYWGGLAGLITGIIGLWVPQAIGGGHTTLEGVLASAYSWWYIPVIFIAKYFLTCVAYGSGVPGGIFAPALILGALGASILGHLLNIALPGIDIDPANFAFVGMGGFFTAISRAPITSIVMLFELTGNYQLVLPMMFACIIANISAERLREGSIYENLLARDGINIKEFASPSYLQKFCVEDAMTSGVDVVKPDMVLEELEQTFENSDHSGFPVVDSQGKPVGVVTTQDLHQAHDSHLDENTLVSDFMSFDLKVLSAHDNLHTAILKLYQFKIGRLLVVDDRNADKLVGIITRSDIINFEANQELDY